MQSWPLRVSADALPLSPPRPWGSRWQQPVLLRRPNPEPSADPQGERRLILMPGATVPGIGIQIANQRGTRRIVRLDPMTGFPRVESVNAQ